MCVVQKFGTPTTVLTLPFGEPCALIRAAAKSIHGIMMMLSCAYFVKIVVFRPVANLSPPFHSLSPLRQKIYTQICRCQSSTTSLTWVTERLPYISTPIYIYIYICICIYIYIYQYNHIYIYIWACVHRYIKKKRIYIYIYTIQDQQTSIQNASKSILNLLKIHQHPRNVHQKSSPQHQTIHPKTIQTYFQVHQNQS